MNFEALVDRYEKPIFNLVFRLIGDYDEAADVTQEVFLAAYQSATGFRGESSEFTWLYRIAVNKCRSAHRKRGRSIATEASSFDDESVGWSQHTAPGVDSAPDRLLEQKEFNERIEQAVSSLPYDFRSVVVLRDMQGLSYQQMSEVLGVSVDLVRIRLSRGRGLLRKKLEPYLQG